MEIFAGAGTSDDPANYSELLWELSILLECTSRADPGKSYGPPEDCYMGWDAEFEARSYTLTGDAGVVIYGGKDHKILAAILGDDVLTEAIESACEAACQEPLD
jgi:hypothetical protein